MSPNTRDYLLTDGFLWAQVVCKCFDAHLSYAHIWIWCMLAGMCGITILVEFSTQLIAAACIVLLDQHIPPRNARLKCGKEPAH